MMLKEILTHLLCSEAHQNYQRYFSIDSGGGKERRQRKLKVLDEEEEKQEQDGAAGKLKVAVQEN